MVPYQRVKWAEIGYERILLLQKAPKDEAESLGNAM
jgi:hypothetical protein